MSFADICEKIDRILTVLHSIIPTNHNQIHWSILKHEAWEFTLKAPFTSTMASIWRILYAKAHWTKIYGAVPSRFHGSASTGICFIVDPLAVQNTYFSYMRTFNVGIVFVKGHEMPTLQPNQKLGHGWCHQKSSNINTEFMAWIYNHIQINHEILLLIHGQLQQQFD